MQFAPTWRDRAPPEPENADRTEPDAAPKPHLLAPKRAPLRLLIVTEARFLGEALAAVLEREIEDATVTCATSAKVLAYRLMPHADAVLVDAVHCHGMATVRRLRETAPALPIIVCAIPETDDDVVSWVEAGATGYLPNTLELARIGSLVSGILDGEQVCSARMAAALLRRVASGAQLRTQYDGGRPLRALTRRERQIAELIAAGLGDKQVARELNISLATAKTHVHNLLGKLQLRHRGEVAEALLGEVPLGQRNHRAPPPRVAATAIAPVFR
jgi:DNA-binding NarL/FixJ family response regulator